MGSDAGRDASEDDPEQIQPVAHVAEPHEAPAEFVDVEDAIGPLDSQEVVRKRSTDSQVLFRIRSDDSQEVNRKRSDDSQEVLRKRSDHSLAADQDKNAPLTPDSVH